MLDQLKEPRNEKSDSIYANPDNDPRGAWTSVSYVNPASREQRPNLCYPIMNPITGKEVNHPTNAWKYEISKHQEHVKDNKLHWGKAGENTYPRLKKFLSEMDGGIVPVNLWYHKDVDTTDSASKDLEILMGAKVFDFPKTIRLIQRMLRINTSGSDLILDFFSGSATTAHAVMQLNAEDGGNRRFICVQLPEQCDEKSEAFKAGYANICEIGKERIRRAGQKIQDELAKSEPKLDFEGESQPALDLGFKVFKLDSSNLETWDPSPISGDQLSLLEERLNRMTDRVKPDRGDLDMVYEIMLKQGLPLTESVTPLDIEGHTVYSVREDSLLLICLEKGLSTEAVEQMAALAPARIIFGQDCFADVTALSNAKLSLKDAGIDFKFV